MKSTRLRATRLVLLCLSATLLTASSGCFGRFRATNAVYDFNKGVSDNGVVRSLVMIGMVIIPVYWVAFLVDAIVLNTMDFFNGNRVAATETLPDGTKVMMAKIDADTVRVRHVDKQGKESSFDVVRVGDRAGFVRAADGHVLGSVEQLGDGRLVQSAP
jgi:hypothetical protein